MYKFILIDEFALIWRVDPRTVQRMIKRKEIDTIKLGGSRRIPVEVAERILHINHEELQRIIPIVKEENEKEKKRRKKIKIKKK